jgi:hypothetical protein
MLAAKGVDAGSVGQEDWLGLERQTLLHVVVR